VVICLERGANDLHMDMVQLMALPPHRRDRTVLTAEQNVGIYSAEVRIYYFAHTS